MVRLTGSVWMLLLCKKPSNLGFGPGPQLLQLLGSCFNSCRCSQQFIFRNDGGILGVHPLCAYNTHTMLAQSVPKNISQLTLFPRISICSIWHTGYYNMALSAHIYIRGVMVLKQRPKPWHKQPWSSVVVWEDKPRPSLNHCHQHLTPHILIYVLCS